MIGEKNLCGEVESRRVQAGSGSGSEPAQTWCGSAPGRGNIASRASVRQGGNASEWRGLGTELKGQRLLIQRMGRLKTSSASAPCLVSTPWPNSSSRPLPWGVAALPPGTLRRTRLSLRIRTTEGQGDGVPNGSTLPPIYGSKITPQAFEQPASWLPTDPARDKGSQGKETPSSPTRPVTQTQPNRKLLGRQEVSVQRAGVRLVRSSVSVLNTGRHRREESQNPGEATAYRSQKSDASPGPDLVAGNKKSLASPDRHATRVQGNPRGSDGRAATGQVKSAPGPCRTRAQVHLCSHDSAIESDSQSSGSNGSENEEDVEEEEEEEYYTDQRIGEWVVRVNASLFSQSDSEISPASHLEEEDVDTIKIIYEQD